MNSTVDHQSDLRDFITLTPEEVEEANAWFDAQLGELRELSEQSSAAK